MKMRHLMAAAALALAGTSASAVTMDVLGGTSVAFGSGDAAAPNYGSSCIAGDPTSCYNPSGSASGLTETIFVFDAGTGYPGLTFSPAGSATLRVTFLGTEAQAENKAVTFGMNGIEMLSNKTNSDGDSYTLRIEDFGGIVPFEFTSDVGSGSMAGFNDFSNGAAIAFSEVFRGGRAVYAYFDDSGAREDRDFDDMVVLIEIAPIPLPAAGWMLLAGLGGLYGMRRLRKTA